MTRPRSWTDDQLRQAAAEETSILGVTRRLGLRQNGRTNRLLEAHADRLNITLPNGWNRAADAATVRLEDVRRRQRDPNPDPVQVRLDRDWLVGQLTEAHLELQELHAALTDVEHQASQAANAAQAVAALAAMVRTNTPRPPGTRTPLEGGGRR